MCFMASPHTRSPQPGGAGQRLRLTRFVLPAFCVISVGAWLVAPAAVMRQLTPVVGALAVLCAGLNLARVVWHIRAFSRRHSQVLGRSAKRSMAKLQRSIYAMAGVLVATAGMAAGFYVLATVALEGAGMADQSRLLWLVTAGGLALAVVFGELVTHLVAVVDETMAALARED